MSARIDAGGLKVDASLFQLVKDEIAPGTGVDVAAFWSALGAIVADLAPKHQALLEKRNTIQAQIDE